MLRSCLTEKFPQRFNRQLFNFDMPADLSPQIPAALYILGCSLAALLLVIILLLLRITSRLDSLSYRRSERPASQKPTQTENPSPPPTEVEPGTHFDEFLSEDPQRRALSKKEQSKAYRKWRDDKGLNWIAPLGN